MKRSALFLDRDGTIVEDVGYLRRPEDVIFLPGAFDALAEAKDRFLLFIVTNQSGIGEGTVSFAECAAVNRHIVTELATRDIPIASVYTCPHSKDDQCRCRKAATYFLHKAEEDFRVDLLRSFAIGDHPHDGETALRAGGQGVLVLTGHGGHHRHEVPAEYPVAASIREAVRWVIDKAERSKREPW